MQVVSRKHLITKKDIRNVEVIVRDRTVIRHKDDAKSVQLAVSELQLESYNPVLAFKMQGLLMTTIFIYLKIPFYLLSRQNFRKICINFMEDVYSVLTPHMEQMPTGSN